MEETLFAPQLILIGAHGRNSGKTLLACDIIERFGAEVPIFALKIIGIDHAGQACHRGSEGCGACSSLCGAFELIEDHGAVEGKDTTRMLRAGARRAFLLKSLKSHLLDAFNDFWRRVPKGTLVVCESNTLRTLVRPGVFVFALSEDGKMKPSAREVFPLANVALPHGDTAAARHIQVLKRQDGSIEAVALPQGEPDSPALFPISPTDARPAPSDHR